MPEIVCTTVYQFPELSDAAKEKACQRRLKFPQKCRSKIPQFPALVISRAGDRLSRFSEAALDVWAAVGA